MNESRSLTVAFIHMHALLLNDQTVCLFALDQQGRLWQRTYTATSGWHPWDLIDSPTEGLESASIGAHTLVP